MEPYWVNSSGNTLIRTLLAQAGNETKLRLEALIQGLPITAMIDENMVFGDVGRNENALWSLLLFSGYLKALTHISVDTTFECTLVPLNYEVLALYRGMIKDWFYERTGQLKV